MEEENKIEVPPLVIVETTKEIEEKEEIEEKKEDEPVFDLSAFVQKEPSGKKYSYKKKTSSSGDIPTSASNPSKDFAISKGKEITSKLDYEEWHNKLISLLKEFAPSLTEGCYIITVKKELITTHLALFEYATLIEDLWWDEEKQSYYKLVAEPGKGTHKLYENGIVLPRDNPGCSNSAEQT